MLKLLLCNSLPKFAKVDSLGLAARKYMRSIS